MTNDDWEAQSYKKTFDAVCATVILRKKHDQTFSKEDLRRQLNALYVLEGHDMMGRGKVGDLDMEASIAACEHLLMEWTDQ